MATYEIIYSNLVVSEDIPRLDKVDQRRVGEEILNKLSQTPDQLGKPLRRPHQGYWVIRVGIYRVVYSISKNFVRIVAILPRGTVYQELSRRT